MQRFWDKVDKSGDCWMWTASTRKSYRLLYGQFAFDGRRIAAHRMAYMLAVGEIPDGMQIDHICRNTLCVKPSHLRVVTRKQNMENRSGAQRNSLSGVRGVSPDSRRPGKWQVNVGHNGKSLWGGYFDTLEEAEAKAIAMRRELFTHNDSDRISP